MPPQLSSNSHSRELWRSQNVSATNMDHFRRFVNSRYSLSLKDFWELHAWSVGTKTAGDFWLSVWNYVGMTSSTIAPDIAFIPTGVMFPPPRFFPQVRMNFAEHLLSGKDPAKIALHVCKEGGQGLRSVTWGEVHRSVENLAVALRRENIGVGDRVAAVISNRFETIVICLAVLSLGAIWSTSSPDMGVQGILDRLQQIQPKLVFAESSIVYNGRTRDLMQKHKSWISEMSKLPSFQKAILIAESTAIESNSKEKLETWTDFLKIKNSSSLEFVQLPFDHPAFIVYSSGTTGSPKCIVHSAGGLLLQIKKDYIFHLDCKPGDHFFQYTTTGWIMWAMVLCSLSYGGVTFIYDGSPYQPDPMILFRLASKLGVTLFGTSAKFLTDLKTSGLKPRELVDLSALRTVSSTGSVLTSDVANWFYDEAFPPNVHLISGSGGTDVACGLVTGEPTSPLYSGEIQVPALGMAIDVLDKDEEHPVSVARSGQAGELVCRQPFPSQPIQFWGPDGMERYKNSYFERFGPEIWYQGDFVSVVPSTRGYLMLGRSDGVLNPSGVRFGSAEIYNVTDNIPSFLDTICVGLRRPQDNDESVVLFVKMKPGQKLTPTLILQTKQSISKTLSPRHIPKYILQVQDIPYTINGKKVEIAVKQIIAGRKTKPSGTIANPECLKEYANFFDIEYMSRQQEMELAKL